MPALQLAASLLGSETAIFYAVRSRAQMGSGGGGISADDY